MKQWCTRTTDHCRSEVFAKADDGLRTCGSSGEMRPLVEPKWQDQPELGAGTLHPFFLEENVVTDAGRFLKLVVREVIL